MRVLLFLASFFILSCEKSTKVFTPEEMSPCIQKFIIEFTQEQKNNERARIVRHSTVSGDVYLFSDGSEIMDGGSPFINNDCVTVCQTCGECFMPQCWKDLQDVGKENIVIVWPK